MNPEDKIYFIMEKRNNVVKMLQNALLSIWEKTEEQDLDDSKRILNEIKSIALTALEQSTKV